MHYFLLPAHIKGQVVFTDLTREQPKEFYFSRALQALIAAEEIDKDDLQVLEARGQLLFSSQKTLLNDLQPPS